MSLRGICFVGALTVISGTAQAQNHPVFKTAAQEAVYAQMKADYDANPSSPATYGGKFYKYIKNSADSATDSTALANTWMYHVTGTASYATNAYNNTGLQDWLNKPELEPNLCRNVSSDSYPLRVLIYDWIYTGISAGNRTTFLNKLNQTANICTNNLSLQLPSITDIDQIIGDYFGTAMLHAATTDYNSTINTYWADGTRQIGGLVAEAASYSDRRNTVRRFIEVMGAGGDHSASSQYNVYTYSIILLGYWALDVVGGANNFPEIAATIDNVQESFAHDLSPGFLLPHQWGDDEQTNPRNPESFYRFDSAMCIAGLGQGNTDFQDWLLDWIDSKNGFANASNGSRDAANGANPWFKCSPVWNPYATRGDKGNISKSHWAGEPMGIASVRTSWDSTATWFVSSFPPRRFFDGLVIGDTHHGRQWGDFQFWKNGKWAITHPIGYDGMTTDPRGTGTIVYPLGPIGSWWPEYGGDLSFTDDADYVYVAGTEGGSVIWDDYYNPPPTKLMEDSRSIVWLKAADMIVVHSRTNIDEPRPCPSNYDANFRTWCSARPSLKQLPIHTPVIPTVNAPTIDWTYSAGESVRVTHLLPASVTMTTITDSVEWPVGTFYRGYNNDSEMKYHVAIRPTVDQKWDTFLDVWDVNTGTPRAVTLTQDTSNHVDGVFIETTGQNYLLAFNAIQGADLPGPQYVNGRAWFSVEPHASQVAAILDVVRKRDAGFTLGFTVVSNGTKVLLFDLDIGTGWTYTVNGGAPVGVTPNSEGVGEIDLVTTGAVTLAVLAGGAVPVTISTGSLPNGVKGAACAGTLTAIGGDGGPYTWSATVGTVPSGCTLNANGTWSGTYTTVQSKTFTLQACDGLASCGTREFSMSVIDVPVITTASLSNGAVGSAYNSSCTGSGGSTPYVFTVHSGALCSGLSLNSGTCAITGTPTTVETCQFTIRLTDDAAATFDKDFTVHISAAAAEVRPDIWVDIQAYRAVVNYRLTGLSYNTSCTVSLYDDSQVDPLPTAIDTSTQSVGLARREALFTNLNSNTLYSAIVNCATATASDRTFFTMPADPAAGTRDISFSLRPSAIIPTAARVTVDWDWDTTFAGPTSTQNTSCSTGCTVTVTFPQQGVFYYRWRWQTSGDAVIATSPIQPIVVP